MILASRSDHNNFLLKVSSSKDIWAPIQTNFISFKGPVSEQASPIYINLQGLLVPFLSLVNVAKKIKEEALR